jgi:hypothetical protein
MKRWMAAPACIVLALGALAACSKPGAQSSSQSASSQSADAAAPASAAAGQPSGSDEPVSPPQNGAINTDANKGESQLSPGHNSFTQDQARGRIQDAGYTDIGTLSQTADGVWTAQAKKDGKTVDVFVDFKGAVSAHAPAP